MPQKRNSAGQMQNYVPAGHPAGGEYGDNATGSNKNFKVFKKPSRINELSKKQLKKIGNFVYGKTDLDEEQMKNAIENLRYYTGSFGDLSGFTDDELKQIIAEFRNLEETKEGVWFKEGQKWYKTNRIGLLQKQGIKYYTKEEKEEEINSKNKKVLEGSLKEQDKKVSKILGDKTTVCFGNGYKKEDLDEIVDATTNLVNDFDGLKDFVYAMGDRTNLEKYLNAVRNEKELSEEEILNKVNQLKKYLIFYGGNEEDRYREEAIRQLKGNIKIPAHSRAYAYWDGSNRMMIFMPRMKNASESLKNDYESNFHPTDKNISVYYHEMGHAVDKMIDVLYNDLKNRDLKWDDVLKLNSIKREYLSKIQDLENNNYNRDYEKIYNDAFKEKYGIYPNDMNVYRELQSKGIYFYDAEADIKKELSAKGIKKYNVSKYAGTNSAEFLAECFAGHYCNAGNKYCDEAFNIVNDYYKKLKEFKNGL